MMKCKYCGGNLTLEQAYCPHCGRPNEEAAQHVKDMEHYKSNFEDTKSDVYEVTEKNTEIMSHMIIITVLVILCVVVFVVSARSWSIHRGLLQFDAGIRQGSYMTVSYTHLTYHGNIQITDVDLVFLQLLTYATSYNVLPAIRDLDVPVVCILSLIHI